MVIDAVRVLLWILLCTVAAALEYSTGLPIVTIGLILIAAEGFSTVWRIFFVTLMVAVLAALFMQSWTVVWLLVMAAAVLFGRSGHRSRKTFVTQLSIVILIALLLAVLREPTVTITFWIHTFLSLIVTAYLLWRKSIPKHKGFNVAELRFMSRE